MRTAAPPEVRLAAPGSRAGQRASAWTLVYDGDCRFCLRCVDLVRRCDRARRLRFVAFRDAAALAALPAIPRELLEQAMHLVAPDGRIFVGASAVAPILRLIPGGAPLALLLRLPGAQRMAARVYRWIARNRHRPDVDPRESRR